jgi:hypothetical protein
VRAPAVKAGAVHRPVPDRAAPDRAGLRDALLARVRPAGECPDAEWDAELAELEAAGADLAPPSAEELEGWAHDPLAGPPDGADAWLADLPGPLLEEYLAAIEEPVGPEPIAAGFWNRATGDGAGFASGGVVDDLPPGPTLAGLTADVCAAGLDRVSDDELIGVLRAARRLGSWSAWMELAAAGELAERRLAEEAAGQAGRAEHADAEIAAALTLTGRAADQLLDLAMTLRRLPLTAAALAAGTIDRPRAAAIAEELEGLDDADAAAVEERVLARAAGRTTTQVRAAARQAVLAVDPSAARKRQERAQGDARVERWTEHAGTGALAGRDLPPTGVLAADQHLTDLARALRTAGLAGTMDQLRALVFVALLTGQPVSVLLPPGEAPSRGGPADPGSGIGPCGTGGLGSTGSPGGASGSGGTGDPDGAASRDGSDSPSSAAGRGGAGDFGGLDAAGGPVLRGMINLTMPLGTWLGLGEIPGEVAGFGPVDAVDCRDMARAMAQHPSTRWCLTVIDQSGRPVAHGCARPRRGPPGADPGSPGGPGPPAGGDPGSGAPERPAGAGPGSPGGPGPPGGGDPRSGSGPLAGGDAGSPVATGSSADLGRPGGARSPEGARRPRDAGPPMGVGALPVPAVGARPVPGDGGAGLGLPEGIAAWVAGVPVEWLETSGCAHRRESAGYRPAPSLRHLIRVRQRRCAFPGCGRPARGCDQDHTVPYEQGGRTCECNLAPLCRTHHQAKQAHGWRLDQTQPGIMTWTTPSGRRYTTGPSTYPG